MRFVAAACGRDDPVGGTGPSGRVEALKPRAACRQEFRPRSRRGYPPQQALGLTQGASGFSLRVRRVWRRGPFPSTEDRRQRLLDGIESFNQTLAKPFQWTYAGRSLTA